MDPWDEAFDDYGRHARSRYEGYLQAESLEWLLGGEVDYRKVPVQDKPRHDILAICESGKVPDAMVWYNHGIKAFQRVKGAQRVIEKENRA